MLCAFCCDITGLGDFFPQLPLNEAPNYTTISSKTLLDEVKIKRITNLSQCGEESFFHLVLYKLRHI